MLRFALKHGVAPITRPAISTIWLFIIGLFIENLIAYNQVECFFAEFSLPLRIYGNEAFSYGHDSSAMFFIVDVFAAEMKKILSVGVSTGVAPQDSTSIAQ